LLGVVCVELFLKGGLLLGWIDGSVHGNFVNVFCLVLLVCVILVVVLTWVGMRSWMSGFGMSRVFLLAVRLFRLFLLFLVLLPLLLLVLLLPLLAPQRL
jgi:hypothetical protein